MGRAPDSGGAGPLPVRPRGVARRAHADLAANRRAGTSSSGNGACFFVERPSCTCAAPFLSPPSTPSCRPGLPCLRPSTPRSRRACRAAPPTSSAAYGSAPWRWRSPDPRCAGVRLEPLDPGDGRLGLRLQRGNAAGRVQRCADRLFLSIPAARLFLRTPRSARSRGAQRAHALLAAYAPVGTPGGAGDRRSDLRRPTYTLLLYRATSNRVLFARHRRRRECELSGGRLWRRVPLDLIYSRVRPRVIADAASSIRSCARPPRGGVHVNPFRCKVLHKKLARGSLVQRTPTASPPRHSVMRSTFLPGWSGSGRRSSPASGDCFPGLIQPGSCWCSSPTPIRRRRIRAVRDWSAACTAAMRKAVAEPFISSADRASRRSFRAMPRRSPFCRPDVDTRPSSSSAYADGCLTRVSTGRWSIWTRGRAPSPSFVEKREQEPVSSEPDCSVRSRSPLPPNPSVIKAPSLTSASKRIPDHRSATRSSRSSRSPQEESMVMGEVSPSCTSPWWRWDPGSAARPRR